MSSKNITNKNDKGSLFVELEKPSYNTTETIYGRVKQNFKTLYKFSNLYLEIIAYERVTIFCNDSKVQSAYGYSNKPKQKGTETNFLYNHRFDLTPVLIERGYNEECNEGQYEIPFEFNIDPTMPSSFWEHWTYKESIGSAYTCYRIKARLETIGKGMSYKTLKQEIKFHVDNKSMLYPSQDLDFNVTSRGPLLCANGKASITVNLDKERYKPGETVELTIDIDNSKCQNSIKDIKAKLFQITCIKSNLQKKQTNLVNKILIVYARTIIKSRSKKQIKLEIPLSEYLGTMNTTCTGKLVKNDYQISLKLIYSKMVRNKIQCFTKNPTIKFDQNLYNLPDEKESPTTNCLITEECEPITFDTFNCSFTDEFRTDNNYLTDGTDKDPNENERYETEIAIL